MTDRQTEFPLIDSTPPVRGVESISGNYVCLSVITSTFLIETLQIIPESRQTPHIIHHQKGEDISHDKDTHKEKYKDNKKDELRKRRIQRYSLKKQGVQGYQI